MPEREQRASQIKQASLILSNDAAGVLLLLLFPRYRSKKERMRNTDKWWKMSSHNLIQNQFAEKRGDEEVTGKFVEEEIDFEGAKEFRLWLQGKSLKLAISSSFFHTRHVLLVFHKLSNIICVHSRCAYFFTLSRNLNRKNGAILLSAPAQPAQFTFLSTFWMTY